MVGRQRPALVSVLPDGRPRRRRSSTPGNPGVGTGFGAVGSNCAMGQGTIRHAISADGSVIVWSLRRANTSKAKQPLFARINGSETIQLDAKVAGEAKRRQRPLPGGHRRRLEGLLHRPGQAHHRRRSKNQLYRYDTGQPAKPNNLTTGSHRPPAPGRGRGL